MVKTTFYCMVLVLLVCVVAVKNVIASVSSYEGGEEDGGVGTAGRWVRKEERRPVVATEFGSISSVDIEGGNRRNEYYHLQMITMEPNALFLPVLLHSDMVFYVHTGSGTLSWTDDDEMNNVRLKRGDVYRLKSGTLFYLHSNLELERPRFRIIAIFASPEEEQFQGSSIGPYSSINDLVRGFDKPVLQAAFQVPEEVIEELTSTTETPAIVHADQKSRHKFWEEEILFINALFGTQRFSKHAADNKKKKHAKTFNFFEEGPDFKSCSGWSKVVTRHDLHALHGSQIGVYMVNLTKGSIMGPHWNPSATEISVVLEGEGMVQVVCPSALTNKDCKNSRIRVEEGDVFTVPRFHPMAQTSFNNGSLVFMGFSTSSKKNHPQFLAGKASVLQTLDRFILGVSFNVSNTTVDQLLAAQKGSIILECTSCAEEQETVMEEVIERERREEEIKREEEEARKRKEEERKREEEERRKREEEEQKRKEEEEEQRRREEEEEQRRREEEEQKQKEEEEEEQRRREEEEQRRKEEEEEQRRQEEEEEERRREEEEQRKKEEEEEQRRRQEEEKERKREEEEQRSKGEEKEQRRRQEEEKERKREEEEQRRKEEEEELRKRQEEKQRRKEKEEEQRKRKEEEEKRRHEEEEEQQRREEEEQRQMEEEEQRRREEEEQKQIEEEEQKQHEEEEQRQREKEAQKKRKEEEQKRREEEEEQKRREEEEEQRRQEEEQEEKQRREEEEMHRQEEEERQKQEEEEQHHEHERGRGEEESEEEMAKREEEERVERQREEEGGGRWRSAKLRINHIGRGNQRQKNIGRTTNGRIVSRTMSELINDP